MCAGVAELCQLRRGIVVLWERSRSARLLWLSRGIDTERTKFACDIDCQQDRHEKAGSGGKGPQYRWWEGFLE